MSPRTLRSLTVSVTVIAVGLVVVVVAQVAEYARRVALLGRLTHNVGGPSLLPSLRPSPTQLVLPGLEAVMAVALVAVVVVRTSEGAEARRWWLVSSPGL